MKMMTQKKFQEEWNQAKNQKRKDFLSSIWKLATEDWKMSKVSMKRYRKAERLYDLVKLEWRLTDKELEYDSKESTCGSPEHKRIIEQQSKCIEACKDLAKELNLSVYVGTFLHIGNII